MEVNSENRSQPKIQEVVSLLKESHSRLLRRSTLSMVFVFAGLTFTGLALLVLLEKYFYFTSLFKIAYLTILIITASLSALRLKRVASELSFRSFYHSFFDSTEGNRVHSAVDLFLDEDQRKSKFYISAINSNLKDLQHSTLKEDLKKYTGRSGISNIYRNASLLLFSGLLLLTSAGIFFPEDSQRAFTFWESYNMPNPFEFTVTPGDTTIEHGSEFQAAVSFHSNPRPEQIIFEFKTELEDDFRSRPVQSSEANRFSAASMELTNSITYRLNMDGFKSDLFKADVQLQPRFEELITIVTPPSYTRLPQNRQTYPLSEINLYPGSTLEVTGTSNKSLNTIRIWAENEWNVPEPAEESAGESYTYRLQPEKSDTLYFELTDTDGLRNRNPYTIRVNVRQDQHPSVSILDPVGTVLENDPASIDIQYQATDDFGLTRAELRWQLERAFVETPINDYKSLDTPRNGRTEIYRWNLSELNLRPRDMLTFTIRVWDNDEISGYKWSESQSVIIQVPSLADYFEDLDSQERDLQGELDQVSDNFRDMEREYEEFIEKLRQNPDGGFEEEQMMQEIRDRQEEIDEAVQRMNEQFERLRSEMQRSDNVSEETQQAYRELQQLMNELDDPALREAMEQMQKALESMSPQEIEKALENMNFNENLYRERLERTVELFKQLKMNSDLDKLARQYDDLAERTAPQEDQSLMQLENELETVNKDFENLAQQLDELDNNPPKRSEESLRELKEEASNRLKEVRDLFKELEQNTSDESGNGESSPSEEIQQQQQQISDQLKNEAEKFRNSIQQMSGQQLQVNLAALQQSLYTLLELSNMQEYITKTASETRNRSQGFVELARTQKNVADQFSLVADTLFRVSSEIPGVPNQINRKKAEVERGLSQSMSEMIERNQRGSSVSSRESLGGINDLSSMIASLIDQLQDQQGNGGGGGMSMQQMVEQLQQMSGDQQQLNQQLQDLINDMQGERLTREESERLDQLARQQNEIRQKLRELQQRGALDPGDRSLSEMQRLIEEMEDSINEMRGGITDPLMVQRQQNILSRMLETEESLQQRGESEEREGSAALEYDRTLPPEMTLEQLQQEIRSRLQDPNFTRFSEQYQRLIEQYFEQLQRFEERPVRQ
jgi:hypothetical protein